MDIDGKCQNFAKAGRAKRGKQDQAIAGRRF